MGRINYELIITNYGRSEGQEELEIGNWGGEWRVGSGLTASGYV